eukprot:m.221524 g.221524  ORF g.221524 m.221524 type:complete len:110 (-) comp25803_c0_seq9:304-633(-)
MADLPDDIADDIDDAVMYFVVRNLRVALWSITGEMPGPAEPRAAATRRRFVERHYPVLKSALERLVDANTIKPRDARAVCVATIDALGWSFTGALHRVATAIARAERRD